MAEMGRLVRQFVSKEKIVRLTSALQFVFDQVKYINSTQLNKPPNMKKVANKRKEA